MSKNNHISPEDLTLFNHEMRDVMPLKKQKPKERTECVRPKSFELRIRKATSQSSLSNHSHGASVRTSIDPPDRNRMSSQADILSLQDLSDYYATPVQSESLLIYHQPGIGRMQIQSLRTGQLSYQAKLDLHGLKADDAKIHVTQFLSGQVQAQHRWVLIIHGKGGRFGEAPVLKNLVNHWLRQIPTVLAFHSAQPKHGGAGAVYVLLKTTAHQVMT